VTLLRTSTIITLVSAALLTASSLCSAPAAAYHPEPRVIVLVTELKGGHERDAVQRAARETWGNIVSCYKRHGKREKGTLALRLEIKADGSVIGAKRLKSTLNDAVSTCLSGTLRGHPMPSGKSGSSATISIELAPGDA
jgi:hypothetical protein